MHLKINGSYVPHLEAPNYMATTQSNVHLLFYVMSAFAIPTIFCVGVFSNALSIFIFIFRIEESVQYTFLCGLAVADMYHVAYPLFFQFASYGMAFLTKGEHFLSIMTQFSVGCKFIVFFKSTSTLLTINALLACNIQRFISVYWPIFSKKLTVLAARVVVIGVLVFSLLSGSLNTPYADHEQFSKTGTYWCAYRSHAISHVVYDLVYSNTCLIQVILIFVLNTFLIVKVVLIIRARRELGARPPAEAKSLKALILNAWISYIFLLAELPLMGLMLVRSLMKWNDNLKLYIDLSLWYEIMMTGVYLQSAINFIIYLIRIPEYRWEVKKILLCRDDQQGPRLWRRNRAVFPIASIPERAAEVNRS